jgi:hypothetical protein
VFLVTQTLVYMTAFLQAVITAFTTRPAAALLATPTVHLYNNLYAPVPGSVVGSFTETAFSGYAAATPTISAPVNTSPNCLAAVAPCTFIAVTASPFVPDTIYGYYIESAGVLVAAESFSSPVPITAPGDFIDLQVVLPMQAYMAAS